MKQSQYQWHCPPPFQRLGSKYWMFVGLSVFTVLFGWFTCQSCWFTFHCRSVLIEVFCIPLLPWRSIKKRPIAWNANLNVRYLRPLNRFLRSLVASRHRHVPNDDWIHENSSGSVHMCIWICVCIFLYIWFCVYSEVYIYIFTCEYMNMCEYVYVHLYM